MENNSYLLNRNIKGDLKYQCKEFSRIQKELLEIERQEEEKQTLFNISNYSARDLEKKGICIRKLELIETIFESYGKYISQFQKRSTSLNNKFTRYKFGNGDIVGLFEYTDRLHPEPLYKGVVTLFNDKKISVAFDSEINPISLAKNICLVQLTNQITYDKIKNSLEQLEHFQIEDNNHKLVNVLFNINDPTFKNENSEIRTGYEDIRFFNNNLNQSQKNAIKFSMEANELALIHGPPGTGKTTTVVELILQSVKEGMRVLVVAPSNIAVDNIAEKLICFKNEITFDLCRIGHPARILESIIDISLDSKIEKSPNTKFVKDIKRNIEKVRNDLNRTDRKEKEKRNELKNELRGLREDIGGSYKNTVIDIYQKSQVILATCVGSADYYLKEMLYRSSNKVFDLVVIDECAQATEATCWNSILLGNKLVLAGDHLQLPPTIKSKEVVKELSFTLFDRMLKVYGDKVCRLLITQYRMNEIIMNFSNNELYDGKLIAADEVKDAKPLELIKNYYTEELDNLNLLDKNLISIDTNNLEFYECIDTDSESKYNIGEALICKYIINYLNRNKFEYEHIGIITPYSAQVNHLKNLMPSDEYKFLEISTVDGFQGREKEIIILSLVRSNKKHEVGFLVDERRMNVAITRAKKMIILISDFSTISNNNFLRRMSDYFSLNSYSLDILDNIMDYKEIEEIKFSNILDIKKEERKDEVNKKILKKKQKKSKRIIQNEEKDIIKEDTKSIIKNEIQKEFKKEDLDLSFIKKIQSVIENFIDSQELEYPIEGLSNIERKYLHNYAESKNLIHESHGEGDKRILLLRKKKEKHHSPKYKIQYHKENNIEFKSKYKQKVIEKKGNNWEEIDTLLEDIISKDKSNCCYNNCDAEKSTDKCQFCNKFYCISHLRCVIHDCVIYNKQENPDEKLKKKISEKIHNFEKNRNKKQKDKK